MTLPGRASFRLPANSILLPISIYISNRGWLYYFCRFMKFHIWVFGFIGISWRKIYDKAWFLKNNIPKGHISSSAKLKSIWFFQKTIVSYTASYESVEICIMTYIKFWKSIDLIYLAVKKPSGFTPRWLRCGGSRSWSAPWSSLRGRRWRTSAGTPGCSWRARSVRRGPCTRRFLSVRWARDRCGTCCSPPVGKHSPERYVRPYKLCHTYETWDSPL